MIAVQKLLRPRFVMPVWKLFIQVLRQTPEMVVNAALQEDVDAIGISILSGAHNTVFPKILQLLKEKKMDDVLLTGGGIIPADDMKSLNELGVGKLFPPGTPTTAILLPTSKNGLENIAISNFFRKYFVLVFINFINMYQTLLTELENGIFTIAINRPDKLNALNKTVLNELDQAVQSIYDDKNIKAAIITGQGRKAFVAGADISEFIEVRDEEGADLARKGQQIFLKIENCPKPVVAAVNGFALGGGCELAMACHFRLASDNAKFGQPEVNLGLIPGYGGTQRLTMLVGKGKAMELIMTGDMIDATEAKLLGLVNHVTTPENLLEKTKQILKVILDKSPFAVSKAINAINTFYEFDKNGFNEEIKLFGEVFVSDDKKEGTRAFIEKRKPVFKEQLIV